MVYAHAESVSVGVLGVLIAADTFVLEVTTLCDLFYRQYERGHSRADPGYSGAVAELEQPVVIGVHCPGGCGAVGGDWSGTEGEVWWAVETLRGICPRRRHAHVIGNPDWVTLY